MAHGREPREGGDMVEVITEVHVRIKCDGKGVNVYNVEIFDDLAML